MDVGMRGGLADACVALCSDLIRLITYDGDGLPSRLTREVDVDHQSLLYHRGVLVRRSLVSDT